MQTQDCLKCIDMIYTFTVTWLKNIFLLMSHALCYQASEASSSDREKSTQFCQWFTFMSPSFYGNHFSDPFVCCPSLSLCNTKGNCLLAFHICPWVEKKYRFENQIHFSFGQGGVSVCLISAPIPTLSKSKKEETYKATFPLNLSIYIHYRLE